MEGYTVQFFYKEQEYKNETFIWGPFYWKSSQYLYLNIHIMYVKRTWNKYSLVKK